jgi:ABC-type lipoprotein release transport system permease subunit
MRSVLYGVSVYDAPSMFGVVVVPTLVTTFATFIPTLRITRTDPATTLRDG